MWTKRTIFVSALVSILSLAAAAFAQSRATRNLAAQNDNLISLDFTSGTLEQYVEAIVQAKRDKVTIIVDTGLEEVEVPKASLRDVTLTQGLEWIPRTANARQHGVTLQVLPKPGQLDGGMFLFTTAPTAARPGLPGEDLQVKTFALGLTTDSPPDVPKQDLVQTAIQDAFAIQSLTAKQPVHYNPRTGILTVRGTSRELNMVTQVMNELKVTQQRNTIIQQLQTELDSIKAELKDRADREAK